MTMMKNDTNRRLENIVPNGLITVPRPAKITLPATSNIRSKKFDENDAAERRQDTHPKEAESMQQSTLIQSNISRDARLNNERDQQNGTTTSENHSAFVRVSKEMEKERKNALEHEMQNAPSIPKLLQRAIKTHGKGLKDLSMWYDEEVLSNVTLPYDFVLDYPIIDPLSKAFDTSSMKRIDINRGVPYLGVLLDAGRHYFSINWIRRMIDVMAALNYNMLQFRLTDDQAFNVQLQSQPLLAYPSRLNNNTRVYSTEELHDLVQYAKGKGIVIIPEINVPGHAGSWGGIPDLIVQCPRFICGEGYGVPLNVSNPHLLPVLKDVLTEIVDIFDRPPFLHLGGDEVDMSEACFEEVGEEMFNYEEFESILGRIVEEIGYKESQIIRWETTGKTNYKDLSRTGKITHFWFDTPGKTTAWKTKYGEDFNDPIFLSSGLYFDTNQEDSAWDIYVKTKQLMHLPQDKSPTRGIIVGTFELDSTFWFQRNVVGRLLAVSMGVSSINTTNDAEYFAAYRNLCASAGFKEDLCILYGRPPRRYEAFRNDLKDGREPNVVWRRWKVDICERFTHRIPSRGYKTGSKDQKRITRRLADGAKEKFWKSLYRNATWPGAKFMTNELPIGDGLPRPLLLKGKRLVDYTGVIMDMSTFPVSHTRLRNILSDIAAPLGLNLAQLRLVDDTSFAYHSDLNPQFFYAKSQRTAVMYPTVGDLIALSKAVGKNGISIMPEIAISTNAGGWYHSNFNVDCGEFLCEQGRRIPTDVNNPDFIPMVFTMIQELLEFTNGPFIHLGSDERETNLPCFVEASRKGHKPRFEDFEETLGRLLEFAGVTNDRVVRWQNHEKLHYVGRIGAITQYNAKDSDQIRDGDMSAIIQPWFGTIDVRRGGPWQVYLSTRKLAEKSPLALVAEIGSMGEYEFERDTIEHRLLAFSMGTLDKPSMTRSQFMEEYAQVCLSYFDAKPKDSSEPHNSSRSKALCKALAGMSNDAPSIKEYDEELHWQKVANSTCKERTQSWQKIVFKDNGGIPTAVSLNGGLVQHTVDVV